MQGYFKYAIKYVLPSTKDRLSVLRKKNLFSFKIPLLAVIFLQQFKSFLLYLLQPG